MNPDDITIGDIADYISAVKQALGNITITSFNELFDRIEEFLESAGAMDAEVKAALDAARAALNENPGLFEEGKDNVIAYLDELVATYPPSTKLSDIPGFQGGDGDGDGKPDVITIGDLDFIKIAALRDAVTVTYDPETKIVTVDGAGYSYQQPNIDRLQFDDGYVAFDFDGVAGKMFRLYQAAFDREADFEGLGYWIRHQDEMRSSLNDVIDSFVKSPEFIERYGDEASVTNATFVELLYTNTLSRDFDQEGFDYWVSRLEAGETNRVDLLAFFSESDENKSKTAEATADGIWYV